MILAKPFRWLNSGAKWISRRSSSAISCANLTSREQAFHTLDSYQ
jgi:hypothetical protein